jgi:hypothetical protein
MVRREEEQGVLPGYMRCTWLLLANDPAGSFSF